jgi:endonuclease III
LIASSGRSERLLVVDSILAAVYGRPIWRSHGPPLDVLIATVLSQHTSDSNTARSFAALRARYRTWEDVSEAPWAEVADAIRLGGLAEKKAPRIQQIAHIVQEQCEGDLSRWLESLPLAAARNWLTELPGVGPKTAACVLLFSMGRPAMPVDTHVHRVSLRLGLLDPGVSPEAAHALFDLLLQGNRDLTYSLHLNLIRHGRDTCQARNPACSRCCLAERCPSAS